MTRRAFMRASMTAWRFLWCFHIDMYGDFGNGLTNRQPLLKNVQSQLDTNWGSSKILVANCP